MTHLAKTQAHADICPTCGRLARSFVFNFARKQYECEQCRKAAEAAPTKPGEPHLRVVRQDGA